MTILKKILPNVLLLVCLCTYANQTDSILFRLNQAMNRKEQYIAIKEQNIEKIKLLLTVKNLSLTQQYDIHHKLYEEYIKFSSDSAIVYMNKNRNIAIQLDDRELMDETAIYLSGLYSTTGFYIETSELLHGINRKTLSGRLLPLYFKTYSAFFSHYGQSNGHQFYYELSGLYRDSLLFTLDTRLFAYRLEYAARQTFMNEEPVPENALLTLLDECGNCSERGYIAWLLGYMYQEMGDMELCHLYFAISTISDIEHCNRDNASMQSLSLLYLQQGNIESANLFIHSAMDDALFCNVRYRLSEASTYFPIINAIYQEQEKKQMTRLYILLIVISLLLMILIISLFFFYRQNHRLSRVSMALSQANQKLNDLNHQLTKTNNSLQESNLVKEEYITHFFDICSAYVDKLEAYRRNLNKHAKNNRMDEILKILDYNIVKQELRELYQKFDTIFLNLYPTFVEDFNALRPESERIMLKDGELLNTELRIFALIRLGINDSVRIASFLRYSLSAIYNYRVKARKYCNADKKTFEELLMKMGN